MAEGGCKSGCINLACDRFEENSSGGDVASAVAAASAADSRRDDCCTNATCVPLHQGASSATASAASCTKVCYPDSPAPISADSPDQELIDTVRTLSAEFLGTATLVMIVVGSGIMAERLSNDVGVQLLINSVATVCGLYGLITTLGPISGAHFNPVVSLVDALNRDMQPTTLGAYAVSQVFGGISGCIVANVQFGEPVAISTKERFGYNLWISEIVATASLLFVIHGCIRTGSRDSVPAAVSAWVGGGYFFTSSSIFANPAVTIGRVFTDSFAGISPKSMAVYIAFQLIGAFVGFLLIRFFYPKHLQPLTKEDTLYRRVCVIDTRSFYDKEHY